VPPDIWTATVAVATGGDGAWRHPLGRVEVPLTPDGAIPILNLRSGCAAASSASGGITGGQPMLTNARATAMLPVVDMPRARQVYEQALGLPAPTVRPNGEARYEAGGLSFALYPRKSPTTADHTALSFEVSDIAAEMRALRTRGVQFEEYDLPGLKTTHGVCVLGAERAAWFRDPEGNILCIHQDG
jgi:catechol 2,3-dioxygenase-like lactoylglutathione lyase family enzyme